MADASLLAARVREVLHYDPETGVFTRKVRLAQRHKEGDRADFEVTSGGLKGYRRVSFDSRRYLAHRVAWLYMHGRWPEPFVDHINGIKGDNRICNLREADERLNAENKRHPTKGNRSGFLGVYMHTDGRWRTRIQVRGVAHHIGLFETPEAAHAAYLVAKQRYHEGCTI